MFNRQSRLVLAPFTPVKVAPFETGANNNTSLRRELAPLQWHLLSRAKTLKEVKDWLGKNRLPSGQTSQEIIASLMADTIGTDNENIIRDIIAPPQRESLSIKIYWRNGPPDVLHLTQRVQQNVHQLVFNK